MRETIIVDSQSGSVIRNNLVIKNESLRISFCGGPGDVVGTYEYWRNGLQDPRVPSVTYSSQLFELSTHLKASLQMISPFSAPPQIDHDIQFDQVIKNKWSGRIDYYRMQRKYIQDVLRKVEKFDPHIMIVSTDFPSSGWGRLKSGRKLILTAHNTFWPMGLHPSGFKGKIKIKLLEKRSKHLDGAVCTSNECARQIKLISRGRIEGLAEYPQIYAKYNIQERARVRNILYLGRIERNKGIFMLLSAFRELKEQFPEIELTFAGSGSGDGELHNEIAEANVSGLRFIGRLDSDAVHEAISHADLLVCPTTSGFNEGLALVGFEAAAHGIPTLLSSVVPAKELLGESAISFQADSLQDLVLKLKKVIADADVYALLAKNTYHVRSRLYDPELSWGSQLAKVLQKI